MGGTFEPTACPTKNPSVGVHEWPTWQTNAHRQWQCLCTRHSIFPSWRLRARAYQGQRKKRWAVPSSMSGFRRRPPVTPQGITCCRPRTVYVSCTEVYPVGTCGFGLAPMHQRGITRCRERVRPRTHTRLSMQEGDAAAYQLSREGACMAAAALAAPARVPSAASPASSDAAMGAGTVAGIPAAVLGAVA